MGSTQRCSSSSWNVRRRGAPLLAGAALAVAAAACSSSPSATSSTSTTAASSAGTSSGATSTTGTSASAANSSGASGTVKTATVGSLGSVLVDAQGVTLYTLKTESDGHIHCTGSCATTWPPLTMASGSPTAGSGVHGTLATVMRPDGTTQVTFDGMPLYRYAGDSGPGQANGQGVGGVWYVVSAGGTAAATTTTVASGGGYGGGY